MIQGATEGRTHYDFPRDTDVQVFPKQEVIEVYPPDAEPVTLPFPRNSRISLKEVGDVTRITIDKPTGKRA